MILFVERTTYINVLKAYFRPNLSVIHLGEIRRVSDVWQVRFCGRDWTYYTDLLNGSEKRQIIGMCDKLNGEVIGPTDSPDDSRTRWNQIIGASVVETT